MEGGVAGDDGAGLVAQGGDLLVLVGIGGRAGVDQVLPQLEVVGQDLLVVKAQALVVRRKEGHAVLADPVIEQVGVDEGRPAETVLAGRFLDGQADGLEIVPGPAVLGRLDAGFLQDGGVIDESQQGACQGDAHQFAVDGARAQQRLVDGGSVQSAVRRIAAQIGQGAVFGVGGNVHVVHLDDVGHAAGGGVGGQLFKVAVPAGGCGLEMDAGVQLGVLVQQLLGVLVAGLPAPPGDADGHIPAGRRGRAARRCAGRAGSAAARRRTAAGGQGPGRTGRAHHVEKRSARDLFHGGDSSCMFFPAGPFVRGPFCWLYSTAFFQKQNGKSRSFFWKKPAFVLRAI